MFGIIGIMSGVIVFYWPKLRLPDSPEFKLFNSNHPFEIYDNLYRDKFWFEKLYTVIIIIIITECNSNSFKYFFLVIRYI